MDEDTLANAPANGESTALESDHFITPQGHEVPVPAGNSIEDRQNKNRLMDNVVPVDSVKNPLALDFDDRDDMIYWSDIGLKTINRAHLNGSAQRVIVANGLGNHTS